MQDLIPYLVKHQYSQKVRPGSHAAKKETVEPQENGAAEKRQQGSSDSLERAEAAVPSPSVNSTAPDHAWQCGSLLGFWDVCSYAGWFTIHSLEPQSAQFVWMLAGQLDCYFASDRQYHISGTAGTDYAMMSHSLDGQQEHAGSSWCCEAVVFGKDSYCARTATLHSFCEVNRWSTPKAAIAIKHFSAGDAIGAGQLRGLPVMPFMSPIFV
jgi:hypothetical protein